LIDAVTGAHLWADRFESRRLIFRPLKWLDEHIQKQCPDFSVEEIEGHLLIASGFGPSSK
jgi:hypothetical protein